MGKGSDGTHLTTPAAAPVVVSPTEVLQHPPPKKGERRRRPGPPLPPPPPKGLANVGNTCYANAALQCLLSTALTSALLNPHAMVEFKGSATNPNLLLTTTCRGDFDPNASSGSQEQHRRRVLEQQRLKDTSAWLTQELTVVIKSHRKRIRIRSSKSMNEDGSLSPRSTIGWGPYFSSTTCKSTSSCLIVDPGNITRHPQRLSTCLRPYQLEDSHEFLRALLSALTVNGQNSQLSSLFDGLLESAVTCQTCHHASVTRDRYMDLSLDIVQDSITTLQDALGEFTKTEVLDGLNQVTCENCRCKRTVTKGLRLATAPSILVCHLKRFAFDPHTGEMRRLAKHVQFPLKLEGVERYMSRVNQAKPPPYDLVAVLVHQGRRCESGHYLAYVRGGDGTSWYKANDESITKVPVEEVLRQQAYVLMYEVAGMRRTKSRPTTVENDSSSRPHSYYVDDEYDWLDEEEDEMLEPVKDAASNDYLCGAGMFSLSDFCLTNHSQEQTTPLLTNHALARKTSSLMDDVDDDDDDDDDDEGAGTDVEDDLIYPTVVDPATRFPKSMSGSNLNQLEHSRRAYRRSASTTTASEASNLVRHHHQSFGGVSSVDGGVHTLSVLKAIGASPPSPTTKTKPKKKNVRSHSMQRLTTASSTSTSARGKKERISVESTAEARRRNAESVPPLSRR